MESSFSPSPAIAPYQQIVNYASLRAKDQMRMTIAAQILTGIVTGNNTIYTHDPDACRSRHQMVDEAISLADLLLEKLAKNPSE